jgi:hypothetical protein
MKNKFNNRERERERERGCFELTSQVWTLDARMSFISYWDFGSVLCVS